MWIIPFEGFTPLWVDGSGGQGSRSVYPSPAAPVQRQGPCLLLGALLKGTGRRINLTWMSFGLLHIHQRAVILRAYIEEICT